jgi:hypothetical protein
MDQQGLRAEIGGHHGFCENAKTAPDRPNSSQARRKEECNMARVELNNPAPDFSLRDFNGHDVSLSDYADQKNVLVVFNRGFS